MARSHLQAELLRSVKTGHRSGPQRPNPASPGGWGPRCQNIHFALTSVSREHGRCSPGCPRTEAGLSSADGAPGLAASALAPRGDRSPRRPRRPPQQVTSRLAPSWALTSSCPPAGGSRSSLPKGHVWCLGKRVLPHLLQDRGPAVRTALPLGGGVGGTFLHPTQEVPLDPQRLLLPLHHARLTPGSSSTSGPSKPPTGWA